MHELPLHISILQQLHYILWKQILTNMIAD